MVLAAPRMGMRGAGGFSRALAHHKDPVTAYLRELRDELMPVDAGEVARCIPALAKADPRHLGIAIATTDGRLFEAGDTGVAFTIQSVAYGHAFACHGRPAVFDRVGVETTGDSFNSIVLDEEANAPYNPMVNAGTIAVAELYPAIRVSSAYTISLTRTDAPSRADRWT